MINIDEGKGKWSSIACVNRILDNPINLAQGSIYSQENFWKIAKILYEKKPKNSIFGKETSLKKDLIKFLISEDGKNYRTIFFSATGIKKIIADPKFIIKRDKNDNFIFKRIANSINAFINDAMNTSFADNDLENIFKIKMQKTLVTGFGSFREFKIFLSTVKPPFILKFIDDNSKDEFCILLKDANDDFITLNGVYSKNKGIKRSWRSIADEWYKPGRMHCNRKSLDSIYEVY